MGSGSSTLSGSSSEYKPSLSTSGTPFDITNFTPQSNSSKKYALLIGCNYVNTNNELQGCINDVNSINSLFTQWNLGYEMTIMTDNSSGNLYPTRQNILTNFTNLVNKLTANDVLFVYYSGHGSLVRDNNGDEVSGFDSVIIPLDYKTAGYIVDDSLRSILASAAENSNIFAVFDSCNSGSVCDLRYNLFDTSYRSSPFIKQRVNADPDLVQRNTVITNERYVETKANVISLSGCKDNEYSYEIVTVEGRYGGGLTYSFLKCLASQISTINFTNLLFDIKRTLSSLRLSQNPSLMCGKAFDPDMKLTTFLKI